MNTRADRVSVIWSGILAILLSAVPIINQSSAATQSFFPVETVPTAIVMNPQTGKLYLINHNNSITVLDPNSHTALSWIFLESYEQWPNPDISLAANPVTGKLYAASRSTELIYVIDGESDKVIKEIPLGQFTSGHSIAVNPDTNRIYVATLNDLLYVIDGSTDGIIQSIDIGDHTVMAGDTGWEQPAELTLNPKTNLIYATNAGSDLISVINGTDNRIIGNITIASPFAAVINPNSNKLYVSYQSSEAIKVFDGTSFAEIGTISDAYAAGFNNAGIAINPETNTIFAAKSDPSGVDSVVIIDGKEDKKVDEIKMDFPLTGMWVDPSTGRLYASVNGYSAIYVIEGSGQGQPTNPESGWISESARLEHSVKESNRIITGMVTDKEIMGNTEYVWISVYEWLKNEVKNAGQVILDLEGPASASTKDPDFVIGEEVLLMLNDIDVVNGHFGLYHAYAEDPSKYSITMRKEVVSLVEKLSESKTQVQKEEEEFSQLLNQSGSENCGIKEIEWTAGSNDRFFYCTYEDEEMRFYVPISVTLAHVKEELLKHVSGQYFNDHFDLRRAWDEAVVNGHAVPTGQMLEFEYTLDNFTFVYTVHVHLGYEEKDKSSLYMSYFPPSEITHSAVQDRNQVDSIIYNSSCLKPGTPYVLYDRGAVSHAGSGLFSPVMSGRGPPDAFDRYGNQIKEAEKRFQIWFDTGKILCTSSVKQEDEIDNATGRPKELLLMDAGDYIGGPASKPEPDRSSTVDGQQLVLVVGVGAAAAGAIVLITVRKRKK